MSTPPREAAAAAPVDGCCLGFDFGTRWIGVAVGTTLTGSARALETLTPHDGGPDWPRIDALIAQWRPVALVVGLPLTLDGGEQPHSRRARRFARELGERSGRPVFLHDERHTSQEAAARFALQRRAGLRRRRDAANLDAAAAAIILESWLTTAHDH